MDGARGRGIPPKDAITGGFSDGADFFTYILAGLLIGLLLDWLTGWSPIMTIVWSLFGVGVGSYRMWVRSAAIEEEADGITHGTDVDPLGRYRPVPDERPIEAIIGKNIAKRSLFVAPVLALIFGILQGWPGAVAALVGVAIVVGNFLLGGYIMARAARVSMNMYHAAALFGFLIRLGLITASMLIIANVTDLDRMAMGISVVVSYLVLLSWEAVAVMNGAERDLEWSN